MTGEKERHRPPGRALPLGLMSLLGALYLLGFLMLDWSGGWFAAVASAAACASLLYAARSGPGAESWRWFAAAAACWSVGAATSAISSAVLDVTMATSLGDLFYLAALLPLAMGFVSSTRVPRTPRRWLVYAADTYVCGTALFVVGWDSIFGRLFRENGDSPTRFLLELRYPILDLVLLCALLPFVLGAARGRRPTAVTAYLALLVVTVGDVTSTAVRLDGGGAGGLGEFLRYGGVLLLGAAPWLGRGVRRGEPRGRMVGPGFAPALLAGASAMFVAGHTLTGGEPVEPVVLVVTGTALLVLVARLTDLLRENERLRGEVRTAEEHFRALAESVDDLVLICDETGSVHYVSAGDQWSSSHSLDGLLGHPLQDFLHPEDRPAVEEALSGCFADRGGRLRLRCRLRTTDGTWLPTESTFSRYSPGSLLVTARDLSEEAALKRQVTHLTFHDGLTGLPNRAYLEERTRQVLSRRNPVTAVIFVDLDGFTAVNDSAGHAAGDQVLAQAARRLRAGVPADDTVARWGGDEFAVLVETAADAQTVVDLAERLLRALSDDPYRVGDRGIVLSAGVGVAFADEALASTTEVHAADETGSASLIRNGDLAMTRAKELGGGRVEVFATQMHAAVVRRLELGSDLQRALADREFTVEFQPVVELEGGRITGVEALLRWRREDVTVPPEEFIGAAEESGLIVPLGAWMLGEACREAARWRSGGRELGLSVNLTARQIAAPKFAETVAEALAESGLPPHALTLEVREEVLVEYLQGEEQHLARLSALRDLGVRLAIDDFGTGYASLAYLGQLPVDVLKIDPSFVSGVGRDETLTLLTRTIVRVGAELGLVVVAEGIECRDQLERLREMGCARGQGFLVARPMPADRIDAELAGADEDEGVPVRVQAG